MCGILRRHFNIPAVVLNSHANFHIDTMKVDDLRPNANVDEIVLKIVEKGEPREVTKRYGGTAHVCDMVGEDEDGNTVQITLWNDEIDQVNVNETVKIKDGWVKEWNGQLQISMGRSGTISHM
jgi:replication factor A1